MNTDKSNENKLSIDYSKYTDDELVNNISDLIVFPEYIFKGVILPILLCIALYISGFFIFDMGFVKTVIYSIVGFLLFGLTGIISGVYLLISKFGDDIDDILDRTLALTNKCLQDAEEKIDDKSKINRNSAAKNIFAGISQVVILPSIVRVIENKLPVIGFVVSGAINKILSYFSKNVTIKDKNIEANNQDYDTAVQEREVEFEEREAIISKVFRIVKFPFKIAVTILIISLIIFLVIMW